MDKEFGDPEAPDNLAPCADDASPCTLEPSRPNERSLPQNRQRVAALYAAYRSSLVATLKQAFGLGPPDPEDVAQQAFYRLVERADLSDIQNLKAFLWRTARNIVLTDLEKTKSRSRFDYELEHLFFPSQGDALTPERVFEAKEQIEVINSVLKGMPKMRRDAFILHKVYGLPVTQVAKRLLITRTPAQKHITRAAHQIDLALADLQRKQQS